jgi:hypothetical protein
MSTCEGASTVRINIRDEMNKLLSKVGPASDSFPVPDRIWDLYAQKGIRTVFLTIGASSSALADLEIAENIGCPLHIVPLNSSELSSWTEVLNVLKERKRDGGTPFSEGTDTKWILPKNIRLQDALPWWENGTVDISGHTIRTQRVAQFMKTLTTPMKIQDDTRLDILKIDATSTPGLERSLLGAILSAGFRPATILVRWTNMPDIDLSTTLAAGHLQNCGYTLLAKEGNKFLYYFSDDDLYQICSWEGLSLQNPILTELMRAMKSPTT